MIKRSILIVDSSKAIRILLGQLFEMLIPDYQAIIVSDGFEALDRLQQQSFELALIEYAIPGLNGVELAEIVRRVSPETQVVLTFNRGGIYHLSSAMRALDINTYLQKPFTLTQLRDVLGQTTEQKADLT
jgi:DNA-binding NtrC family response regulator